MSETLHNDIHKILADGIQSGEVVTIRELTRKIRELPKEQQTTCSDDETLEQLETALGQHDGEIQEALLELKNQLTSCTSSETLETQDTTRYGFEGFTEEFESYVGLPKILAFYEGQFDRIIAEKFAGKFDAETLDAMKIIGWKGWLKNTQDFGSIAAEGAKYILSLGTQGQEVDSKNGKAFVENLFGDIEIFCQKVSEAKTKDPLLDTSNIGILEGIYIGQNNVKDPINNTELYTQLKEDTKNFGEKSGDMSISLAGIVERFMPDLSEILLEHPWVGVVLSIFGLGGLVEKYSDTNSQKKTSSLSQLETLAQQNGSPIFGYIPQGFLGTLELEKLDTFFKYCEKEGIEYSHENFWEEVLSGNSKNPKIILISQACQGEGSTVFEASDFKQDNFYKKLNSVPQKIEEIHAQQVTQAKQDASEELAVVLGIPSSTSTNTPGTSDPHNNEAGEDTGRPPETPTKIENSHEEVRISLLKYRESIIKSTLFDAQSFPIIFTYDPKYLSAFEVENIYLPKKIEIDGSDIMIDGKRYEIRFEGVTHNIATINSVSVNGISFQEGNLKVSLNAEYSAIIKSGVEQSDFSLSKTDMIEIFLAVLESGSIKKDIPHLSTSLGNITGGNYTIAPKENT